MRPVRAVLGGLFLVLPVAFWPGSTSFDVPKFTLAGLAVGICLIALGLAERSLPRPPRMLVIGGATLLAVMLTGLGHAVSPDLVLRSAWIFGLWWLLVLLTAMTADSIRGYLAACIAGVVVSCLYGWTQMAGWLPGAPAASGLPAGISTLGNQNYLAGLAAVAFLPSLILWNGGRRYPAIAGSVVIGATVIIGGATGPQVALGAAALILGLVHLLSRRNPRVWAPRILGTTLVLGAVIAAFLVADVLRSPSGESGSSVIGRLMTENSGDLRRTDWHVAWAMFRTEPILGVGAGNHQVRWIDTRARLGAVSDDLDLSLYGQSATRAHQEYLQAVAETGVLGVLAGLCILVMAVRAWRRRWEAWKVPWAWHAYLLGTGAIITAGIHALVSFPFHLPATGTVLALVVGFLFPAHPDERVSVLRAARSLLVVAGLACAAFSLGIFAADLTIARGQRAFVAGDLETARTLLGRGVDRTPWPGPGLTFLGMAEIAAGQSERGLALLEEGTRNAPGYPGLLILAEARIDGGDFEEAASLLETVMRARPLIDVQFQTRYLLALIPLRRGEFDRAEPLLRELLVDDPGNYRAMLALGYLEIRRDRRAAGRDLYRQAEKEIRNRLEARKTPANLEEAGERLRLQRNLAVARKAIASTGQR